MSDTNRFEDDELRDPALRRALDHAPDRDDAPAPRTREAILKMAHNLAAAPVPTAAAANSASAAPWWRRLLGGGGAPRSRMPWNAAFATVLVAAFVTVLWRSEPVPEARLDGEARVGGAAAPAQAPVAPAAESAAPPAVPAAGPPAAAAPEPAPPAAAQQQAPAAPPCWPKAAEQRAKVPRDASAAKESVDAGRAEASRRAAPQLSAKQAPAAKESAAEPAAPAAADVPAAPSTPPAIVAEQAAPAPAQEDRREERLEDERRRAIVPSAPAAAMAPPPPAAPAAPTAPAATAPLARKQQDASAFASQGSANADVSGALRDASPRAFAKPARPPGAAPDFSALAQWTSLRVARAGTDMHRARGDVEGLAALVSTVARSATASDVPLGAPVEARVELYRGETLVAVLELAGDQVRWTPQPGGASRVGTPPAQALEAMRSLLAR
jgi:hypothetical protein